MCEWVRGGEREAQISRFKASFAYCASRRRVFGRPITVACHFPLGYFFSTLFFSFSSFFFVAPPRPFPGFCHFHCTHVCIRPRSPAAGSFPTSSSISRSKEIHRERSSLITHVCSPPLILLRPDRPSPFPRSFTRFPFIRSGAGSIASVYVALAYPISFSRSP